MKLFTTFENFLNENFNSNYEKFDEEKWTSYYEYIKHLLIKNFGKPNFYSGSAEWATRDVWSLKGDNYSGIFLVYMDDNIAIIERPERFGEPDDKEDIVIDEIDLFYPYKEDYSEKLFNFIDKALAIKNNI